MSAPGTPAGPAAPPRAPGSARVMMGRTMLILEVFVVLFGVLTAYGLRLVDPAPLAAGGLAIAALCVAAVASLRRRLGWVLAALAQVALLATALVLPAMLAAVVVFTPLVVVAYVVGGRIDVERRRRHAAEVEHWRARREAAAPASS